MKFYRILLGIFIIFLFASYQFQKQKYPVTRDGRPSKNGIQYYVKQNSDQIISEFQKFVHDTLYDVYISTDNLSTYSVDSDVLGYCLSSAISSEIIITYEEKFIGYDVASISKIPNKKIIEANNLVKGTIIHELGHFYFDQVMRETRMMDTLHQINPDYANRFIIVPRNSFGSKFIEEGIAEYILIKMGEEIVSDQTYELGSTEEIINKENRFKVFYQYAPQYIKGFVDYWGIKKAIKIFVTNSPPSYEEILYPPRFYKRLIID